MSNIEDYLEWRGDIPFFVDPFNEVDNLILSELIYTNFDGIVPGQDSKEKISLKAASKEFFIRKKDEEVQTALSSLRMAPTLMEKMAVTKRFSDMKLYNYVSEIDEDTQMQFCAMTYELPDKSLYVVFRGTDNTIVGWQEDFNMSFLDELPGQKRARDYINRNFSRTGRSIRVGGHSKGGNLAVYGSAFCKEGIQEKIEYVYSNDGPGFRESVINQPGYLNILSRVRSYAPEESIVSMILHKKMKPVVVKSSLKGPEQHNGLSWLVSGNHFVYADNLSKQSYLFGDTLRNWLFGLSDPEREEFANTLFEVLYSGGNTTLDDLVEYKTKTLRNAFKTVSKMEPEKRKMFMEVLKKLYDTGNEAYKSSIRKKISTFMKKWENESSKE